MRNFTKDEIEKLKFYWYRLKAIHEEMIEQVMELEQEMQEDMELDLEFFPGYDNTYCGIGNVSRTIKLILNDELEK